MFDTYKIIFLKRASFLLYDGGGGGKQNQIIYGALKVLSHFIHFMALKTKSAFFVWALKLPFLKKLEFLCYSKYNLGFYATKCFRIYSYFPQTV